MSTEASSSATQTPTTATPTPQKTFNLACHCGNVKFQADLDQDLGKSGRCNCSSCFITRLWAHPVTNLDSFKLLSSEDTVSVYNYASKRVDHYFCKTCGTQTYLKTDIPGYGKFIYVSINCLQGLTQEQFAAIPIHSYANGAEDKHHETPKFTNHL
ncbi:hypothetical protein SAMD00019534_052400 [Acytostelium subglobosum LB1]|uniref:hypothetical protein n=1 Tax=Acytostelium subglobosum LB1 TaxID=1410327 RepID=UPI000644B96C|nr:hypothetical protein SAMD00019534_052400 [Acytostelium subglobosum LB1]GAM22065.1 hypothetical protein SAMD00019534_052400 [Acytostelium subglobosum LB1]|eukprot:XP_012755165.1 hypothetical protein SAMD00019534_052400 [Acytostelium subglobosum LB1]